MSGGEVEWQIVEGDCIEAMREMPEASVDAIVTDPPYGLGFMGKQWDALPPGREWAEACLRGLKPGGHMLAFGGTRTYHRLTCAIEDAGCEIRDCLMWLYAEGFPKSLDVSKAIDKGAGHWRGRAGVLESSNGAMEGPNYERTDKGAPITAAAATWEGWGTALKPAYEPIVMARKPLVGTVADNVQAFGTGALNVDGCRIATSADDAEQIANMGRFGRAGYDKPRGMEAPAPAHATDAVAHEQGRWPANLAFDEAAGAALDAQTGESTSRACRPRGAASGEGWGMRETGAEYDDSGGPSRFFFCAKASTAEREAGTAGPSTIVGPRANHHPTVKPIELMRWLCRLVTPPGGLILDPFAGSGSTGIAAVLEGFDFIGIEREAEYVAIAERRIKWWADQPKGSAAIECLRAERARAQAAGAGQTAFDLTPEGAAG